MKKETILLTKKIVSITSIVGLSAGAVGLMAYGIVQATKDNKYGNYNKSNTRQKPNVQWTGQGENHKMVVDIRSIKMNFGFGNIIDIDPSPFNEAVRKNDSVAKKNFTENMWNIFYNNRKKTGSNPTIIVKTPVFTFKNNYFDLFAWKNTFDIINYFSNEVMWGPEVGALTEFSIVRGINRNGSQVVLGGHSGDRDKRQIKFYPDSFFGGQNIYKPNRDGLFVDVKYMPVSQNSIIKRLFIKSAFNALFADGKMKEILSDENYTKVEGTQKTINITDKNGSDKTLKSDKLFKFETDESIKNILSIKNYENYIESFVTKKNSTFDKDMVLSPGNYTTPKNNALAPGNFYNYSEFKKFIGTRSTLKPIDILIQSDGTKRIVYPYRYLRLLFLKIFTISGRSSAYDGNFLQTFIPQGKKRYKNFLNDPSNPESGIGNVNNDENTGMFLSPLKSFEFSNTKYDITYTDFWTSFDNFADDFSEDIVGTVARIYNAAIGINTSNIIQSANVTHDGRNKKRIIIEKYYGLVDKIRAMKEKDGWAPMDFNEDGKPAIGSFLPSLYLWHMQKETGFKEFLASKHSSTSLTQEQIDAFDKLSKSPIEDIGINWLKYVTSHEYGHHQTLNYIKDLSAGIAIPGEYPSTTEASGIYDTNEEVYLGGTQSSHGYYDTYDKQLVNAFLRTLTGGGFLGEYTLTEGQEEQLKLAMLAQLGESSTKELPDFDILDGTGHVYPSDGTGEFRDDHPAETFKDFATSWRGFRKFGEILRAIPKTIVENWRNGNHGGPSSYPLLAMILNSWDESSYSLNPSLVLPIMPFGRRAEDGTLGDQQVILDSDDPSNYAKIISTVANGWDKLGEDRSNVVPNIDMTGLKVYPGLFGPGGISAPTELYNHQIIDSSGNPVMDGSSVKTTYDQIPLGTETDYLNFVAYLDGHNLIKNMNDLKFVGGSDTKDLHTYTAEKDLNNPNGVPFAQSDATAADIRRATSLKLKVYYDETEKKYYAEKGDGHNNMSIITVDSAVYQNMKLIGIVRRSVLKGLYINDGVRDRKDRYEEILRMKTTGEALVAIKQDVLDELNDPNLAGKRRVLLSKTMVNAPTNKDDFVDWFKDGYGLAGMTPHDNDVWKTLRAKQIFITYWRMLGRTKPFSTDADDFQPTTNIIMFVTMEQIATSQLSETYSTYHDTGAYARFSQVFSDYLYNLPEILTRSVQQLAYSPSDEALTENPLDPDHPYSEYHDGVAFNMPPIFWHIWTKNGQIGAVSHTGGWNEERQDFDYYRTESGFFQDFQIRKQVDSQMYSETSERHMVINRLGKSLVNYLRDSQGIREDQDLSGTYMKEETGFGYLYGYINQEDVDKYRYLAFRNPNTGEVKYLPVRTGYANEFFNTEFGQRSTRTSLLNHYYDKDGNLQTSAAGKEQVGWRSDDFLVKGYADAFLEPDVNYEMYFTKEQNLDQKWNVHTGSRVITIDHSGQYSVERVHREVIINNGYDYYSGAMIIEEKEDDGITTFAIRNGAS